MKKLTRIEINKILRAHELWVNTNGEEGKRADFENANLVRANFENANLKRANLEGAYFKNANLHGANLKNANLKNASLYGANLESANLYGTGIFTFLIKYFAFFHQSIAYSNGYLLKVGCQYYFDIDDRIVRNDEIGKEFEYTDSQIKKMLGMLNFIKTFYIKKEN